MKSFNRLQAQLDFIDTATLADTWYLRISARTLGLMNLSEFCPGCFWVRLHVGDRFPFQIPLPGVFSVIDSFSKRIVHRILDRRVARPSWLPVCSRATSYTTGLHFSRFYCKDPETRIILTGMPDDILQLADGSYHVTDYKTAVVTARQDELLPLYEAQLNAYAYIAQRLVERDPLSPISGISLTFFEPLAEVLDGCIGEEGPQMGFRITWKPLKLRCDWLIPSLLSRAREIFELDQSPAHTQTCRDWELLTRLLRLI